MNIPYRVRHALKKGVVVLLVIALVLGAVLLCGFLWLKRFVVYTRDRGAVLDMSLSGEVPAGVEAKPTPSVSESPLVYINEGENTINTSKELSQFVGYYADLAALEGGLDTVRSQAKALPVGTPIMLDVKTPKGYFLYNSGVSDQRSSKVDNAQFDAMIAELDKSGYYLIARLPAFRDYQFGLNNVSCGLSVRSGAYLWADDDYCYWLDPTESGTLEYLVNIVTELKNMGFDEVVFEEFRFPDMDNLEFSGDRLAALEQAAETLVTSCANEKFALSFVQNPEFGLPEGRTRLYVVGAVAANAANIAQQTGLDDPAARLVFLTEIHDTRFDDYCVLRPLEAAH